MSSILNLLLRLLRCTSGAAALEGALVMPVAISLMAGGVEFGRIYSTAGTADKSMRSAARYLARVPQSAVCGWGLTNAKNLAVYGNIAGTGNPLINGWSTTNVTLQQPSDCATLSTTPIIQLTATVPFTSIMLPAATAALKPLVPAAVPLPNSITMNVQHEERWIGE